MVTQKPYSSLSINWLSVVLGMQLGIMNYQNQTEPALGRDPVFFPYTFCFFPSPLLSVKKIKNVAGQFPVLVST